ncbi:probable ATP-dependent RNA helicase DHX34 [Haliotis cracherodii]|uniref:probable ATP-dependent RNA helicase DHX34 n=1 Tax=Haliotis cracherodii TaxID=6455 RepID=UPI0039E9918A
MTTSDDLSDSDSFLSKEKSSGHKNKRKHSKHKKSKRKHHERDRERERSPEYHDRHLSHTRHRSSGEDKTYIDKSSRYRDGHPKDSRERDVDGSSRYRDVVPNASSRYRDKHHHDHEKPSQKCRQSFVELEKTRNISADKNSDVKSERVHETKYKDKDHHSKKTSLNSDSEEEQQDSDFDFTQHKPSLNRIFFRDQDFIKRGTKEYDDFWAFLVKYQEFQRKKAAKKQSKSKTSTRQEDEGRLGLPRTYDNRYRINLSLVSKDVELFLKKGRLVDYDVGRDLTRERVTKFKGILLHYLDFQQKQKFTKLKKIRSDQENLPIFQYKTMICGMVKRHQVVVVAGDTGCGKSTQVPQYLMEAGFENIACTQPRRIACISLSKRVGYETLNEYGSAVAFQVRFEKSKTRATKILFLTEGLLLRQMTSDPYLKQYDVIVIDEVHERHIFTDFLLGVLKCMLTQREDLKLVLMSATINIELFSGYFENAPVIRVPGRLHPIELEYQPIKRDEMTSRGEKLDPTPYLRIMQTIDHRYPVTERGDLLIFLSGMTEIMTIVEAANQYAQQTKRWIILPLHSALSVQEQDKVFDMSPEGVRKCIVSTNIAETSVTIDGVRFIVDSGKVKEMNFDPKYKMRRLQEFWISRASAEQRKGRAGRTGPGVCYRLYADTDYNSFQEYATPEIQRVTLDTLILQMMSLGLPDARRFPFIEAPEMSSIETSIAFLKEQGALTDDEALTPTGQMLSRLPVDVVIGKMLIMGSIFHMIDPVLTIAAAMSVQSPFTMKAHQDRDAIAARKPLESDHGDPFTLLNAADEWIQVKAEGRGTRKWCQRRGLEEQRFYEMNKLKRQFRDLLKDHGLLDDVQEEERYYTSEERRQRHGERKRLGQLKREQNNESKKRKVLKFTEDDYQLSDGDEDDKGNDIKDLEFRLSHDLSQLQETANKTRCFKLRDVNLLKVILCSGLYPQVALADDCNSYKGDSEQAFHTKNKAFILLHPTSVFASKPEVLRPSDIKDNKTTPSELRGRLSSKHEVLAFVSILETNKPYLINTMRVPALQTITLFSNSIDANADCTRLVCDGWLEIRFPDAESADGVISSILHLRATWLNLLQVRLADTMSQMDDDHKKVGNKARRLEQLLARKLAEFLDSRVTYSIRRVMAAEQQHLYVGMSTDSQDNKEHSVKGGTQVNSYLTVGCLLDDTSASVWGEYTSHMQKVWECPRCHVSLIVSVVERLQHQMECQSADKPLSKDEEAAERESERASQLNPLRRSYFCPDCDQQLSLTATEILKHKKSHKE